MAVTRLKGGEQRFEIAVKRGTDPKVAAAAIARFHRERVVEAQAHNRKIISSEAAIREITAVDGRRGAPLESVKIDGGSIVTLLPFAVREILEYIDALLVIRSPVKTGAYQRNHRLFAGGVETDPENPNLDVKEWIFVNDRPYARKIERGQGSAPDDGVYEGAAALAMKKFGAFAYIRFTFQGIAEAGGRAGGMQSKEKLVLRYPAIRVRLR
jgi:hypothetical protein